MAKNMFSNHLM